ncbi:MAG: CoA transferase [Planctomycetota bacterium]
MPGPLEGVRVLDLSRVLAGPFCTMLLSDLGADVVKVEHPDKGDDARHFGPPFVRGMSTYFISVNRGKRSITLDLKNDADRATFLKLADKADVLVENFRPGVMRKLGLDYESLRKTNKGLVYASISGYGHTGPMSELPAYDIVIQALGGIMSVTGPEGGPPCKVGVSFSDITAGIYAAVGITSALYRRRITGLGERVDVSMLDCQVAIQVPNVTNYLTTGVEPASTGNRNPSISPFAVFPTSDGEIVICAGNDDLWTKFCSCLGIGDRADDPLFLTNADRTVHHVELHQAIEAATRTMTTKECLAMLAAAGVPSGPINSIARTLAHPQVVARNMVAETEHPSYGKVRHQGPAVKFTNSPASVRRPAPLLGEHNSEVPLDWGI